VIDKNESMNDHRHVVSFTPFVNRPREERLRILDDRGDLLDLLAGDDLPPAMEVVARNVENLLSILLDYRDFGAFERERRLDAPGWEKWSDDYKRAFGIDEYARDHPSHFLASGGVRQDPYAGIAYVDEASP
jgi:hypothetical protein